MDRFLEEQVVELNQLTSPQTSEAKIETNEDDHAKSNIGIFSTGKTTILSPSRHADKTFGPSKRYHPHHHEINGSSSGAGLAEYSSPKKLKNDNSASDHHTPKKQKLHENLPEASRTVEMNSSSSLPTSLPFTAMSARSSSKSDHSSEQGSQPKHIAGNAAASVAAGGLSNQDSDSSNARLGQSASVDISLTREISETSGNLSGKFGSVVSSVSGKSLGEGGDKHTSYVANCI